MKTSLIVQSLIVGLTNFLMTASAGDADNMCMGIQVKEGNGKNAKTTDIIEPLSAECYEKLVKSGIQPEVPMCPQTGCKVTYQAIKTVQIRKKKCQIICPHIYHYPRVICDNKEVCGKGKECKKDQFSFTKKVRILAKCGQALSVIEITNQPMCCKCSGRNFDSFLSSIFGLIGK